jgi:hypothetical protein
LNFRFVSKLHVIPRIAGGDRSTFLVLVVAFSGTSMHIWAAALVLAPSDITPVYSYLIEPVTFPMQADTGEEVWRGENQGLGGKSATADAGTRDGYDFRSAGY